MLDWSSAVPLYTNKADLPCWILLNTAKERKRTYRRLLNTAKYDKEPDKSKPNPNLIQTLAQSITQTVTVYP